MKPPIYHGLMKYVSKQRTRFNMPGHKGKVRMKSDNLGKLDLVFTSDTDSMSDPSGFILESENQIAAIFGAKKSFYLTGGTSAGIYAALASVCVAGDKVIIDSECDKSVINAITILALKPVFIKRNYCEKYDINGGINTEELAYTAEKHRDAKAMVITSPTYHGICTNILKASEIAKRNNMFLFVDESNGTHFNFSDEFPESAVNCGADIVIHSLSKTMGSFSGSGLIHLMTNEITEETLRDLLDIYQGGSNATSLLCASENAVLYAFKNAKKYSVLCKEIERGKHLINTNTDIMWFTSEYNNGCFIDETDCTKIVMNFSKSSISGSSAAKILTDKYGIEPYSSDRDNIVFSVSLYNTPTEIRKLVNSCYTIAKLVSTAKTTDKPQEDLPLNDSESTPPKTRISLKVPPYKAFYCEGEAVDYRESAGRICRKIIYRIPQETPVLIPGEKITQSHIERISKFLEYGGKLHGLNANEEIEVLNLGDSFYF